MNNSVEVVRLELIAIRPKQAAQMLSVSTRTAWRLLSAGKLPKPISLGGSKRFLMSDIELFWECDCNMQQFEAMKQADGERWTRNAKRKLPNT